MSEIINENVTELAINENAPETAPEENAPVIENVPAENTFQLGKVSFVSLSSMYQGKFCYCEKDNKYSILVSTKTNENGQLVRDKAILNFTAITQTRDTRFVSEFLNDNLEYYASNWEGLPLLWHLLADCGYQTSKIAQLTGKSQMEVKQELGLQDADITHFYANLGKEISTREYNFRLEYVEKAKKKLGELNTVREYQKAMEAMKRLTEEWGPVLKNYELLKKATEGSFEQVQQIAQQYNLNLNDIA